MANWQGAILTTKGKALQAKVEAGTTKLALTKMKLGNGTISGSQTLEGLTDLVSPQQVITISSITPNTDGTCNIEGIVTNTSLNTGYYLKELGLYATDPDAGEILYAITTDSNPDYLQASGSATVISESLNMTIVISNASSVTATIDSGGLLTVADLAMHNAATDAHSTLLRLHKLGAIYNVGDVAYSPSLPSYVYLECTTSGTTAAAEPTWPTTVGSTVTDGTVVWLLRNKSNYIANGQQIYSTAGTYTFTAPKYALYKVIVIGGGGSGMSGGASTSDISRLPGGGAGGLSIKNIYLAANASISVTVGAGGASVTASVGNNGNTSSFGQYCSATGGHGGGILNGTDGGYGGMGYGGDINAHGEDGGDTAGGGNGGSSYFSGGIRAGTSSAGNGLYGAGTGGSQHNASGTAGDGIIVIKW